MATQVILSTLPFATDADIRRSLRARWRTARARVADGSGSRLKPSPTSSTLTPPTSVTFPGTALKVGTFAFAPGRRRRSDPSAIAISPIAYFSFPVRAGSFATTKPPSDWTSTVCAPSHVQPTPSSTPSYSHTFECAGAAKTTTAAGRAFEAWAAAGFRTFPVAQPAATASNGNTAGIPATTTAERRALKRREYLATTRARSRAIRRALRSMARRPVHVPALLRRSHQNWRQRLRHAVLHRRDRLQVRKHRLQIVVG